MGADSLVREPFGPLVGTDAIDRSAQHGVQDVEAVASEETLWSPSSTRTLI
jgi:hypothetical protein